MNKMATIWEALVGPVQGIIAEIGQLRKKCHALDVLATCMDDVRRCAENHLACYNNWNRASVQAAVTITTNGIKEGFDLGRPHGSRYDTLVTYIDGTNWMKFDDILRELIGGDAGCGAISEFRHAVAIFESTLQLVGYCENRRQHVLKIFELIQRVTISPTVADCFGRAAINCILGSFGEPDACTAVTSTWRSSYRACDDIELPPYALQPITAYHVFDDVVVPVGAYMVRGKGELNELANQLARKHTPDLGKTLQTAVFVHIIAYKK